MAPQFTLYSHKGVRMRRACPAAPLLTLAPQPGPNPLKPAILMEKLGLEYEVIPLVFGDDAETGVKGAKFLKVNPNGRGA
jgi:hypothetical protein